MEEEKKAAWKVLTEQGKDKKHGLLRRACIVEDLNLIRELVKEIPLDAYEGLALSISAYHGKLNTIHVLIGLGAKQPEDLVKVCKDYFFPWSWRARNEN